MRIKNGVKSWNVDRLKPAIVRKIPAKKEAPHEMLLFRETAKRKTARRTVRYPLE